MNERESRWTTAVHMAYCHLPDCPTADGDPDDLTEARKFMAVADAEQVGLAAEVERLSRLLNTMDHFAEVAETCERKSNEWAARMRAIEAALNDHPRLCDVHDDNDPITCGWKHVVASVEYALKEVSQS